MGGKGNTIAGRDPRTPYAFGSQWRLGAVNISFAGIQDGTTNKISLYYGIGSAFPFQAPRHPRRSAVKKFLPLIDAVAATAFLASCSSGGNGPRFSDLFDESAAAEGTGIQFSGIVRAVVILATHDATVRQRQVAQQNGRRAAARLQARHASSAEITTAPRKKPRSQQSATTASAPKPEPPAAPRPKPMKKLPRYIATDTEKDQHTSPQAKKAVMIWETQAETLLGNNVDDVQSTPPLSATAKFDTYSAEYVGSGGSVASLL